MNDKFLNYAFKIGMIVISVVLLVTALIIFINELDYINLYSTPQKSAFTPTVIVSLVFFVLFLLIEFFFTALTIANVTKRIKKERMLIVAIIIMAIISAIVFAILSFVTTDYTDLSMLTKEDTDIYMVQAFREAMKYLMFAVLLLVVQFFNLNIETQNENKSNQENQISNVYEEKRIELEQLLKEQQEKVKIMELQKEIEAIKSKLE
ncbi:MAG: hypothetical protein IJ301_05410 [Clostridia bacterium]|nr:hypothetical protein [Clostridia bacterium]